MRQLLVFCVVILFAGMLGYAQQLVPESIIIQPTQASLSIQLGLEQVYYAPGDKLELNLALNQDAYVYVYSITPHQRVSLLFPNAYQPVNLLKAGKHTIPDRRYSLVIAPPTGSECVQALALAAPLPLDQIIPQGKFSPEAPFPLLGQTPQEFRQTMQRLIIGTVSATGWAAAWTCLEIAKPRARLRVISFPSGAIVYLDGIVQGPAPLEADVKPGRHYVRLIYSGYEEWSQALDLANRSTITLEVRLIPSSLFQSLERSAWLRVVSDPEEADVFVNQRYAGKTPIRFEIEPGHHQVLVSKTGYYSWNRTIDLTHDSDLTLEATLYRIAQSTTPPPSLMPPMPHISTSTPAQPVPTPLPGEVRELPFLSLGFNGGLNESQTPSVGFDFGIPISNRSSMIGGGVSFLMTGGNVPEYENIGSPDDLGLTMTYLEGPEFEFYAKFTLALAGGLGIDVNGGISLQQVAHIAMPLVLTGFSSLDVIVKPNGYQTEKTYFTGLIGLSLRSENLLLSAGFHNRRGWVIGVGVVF